MTDVAYERVSRLFQEALERPPAERAAFLREAAGEDEPLRQRVLRMLELDAAEEAGEETFGAGVAARVLQESLLGPGPDVAEWIPDRIGPYVIVRKIGEGGMGSVFEATQDHPRRTVALKTLRGGLPSASRIRRFEREIRLLARLEHPGIARMIQAGLETTDRGPVPYFSMEFVRGRPVVEAVRADGLDVRARLAIVAEVCDAVQYAHQRGVIHRDLKPANILIEDAAEAGSGGTGGRGPVRILDFGIGRAIDTSGTGDSGDAGGVVRPGDDAVTAATDPGQVIGTLAYMSPEQVLADPDAVDTRTDVYSIGVVLYELLAGQLPLQIGGRPLHEVSRIIVEQEPRRLGLIDRALAGDVETIVSKALEKDPARRYATVAELAADLRRFLADEPISARPATTFYQVRKFARRHRPLVAAIVAVAAILVIATVVSVRWAVVASNSRDAERLASGLALEREQEMSWLSYRSGITAAAALAETSPGEARRQLDAVPEEHRNWEWDHLAHRIGRPIRRFDVGVIAWTADGGLIGARLEDERVRLVDPRSDRELGVLEAREPVGRAFFLDEGRHLVLVPRDRFTGSELWRVDEPRRLAILEPDERVDVRSVPEDGSIVVLGPASRGLRLLDPETGAVRLELATPSRVVDIRPVPTGGLRVRLEESAAIVDPASGRQLEPWRSTATWSFVASDPAGTLGASVVGREPAISLVDIATGTVRLRLPGHTGGVTEVVFSPSGRRLASRGTDDAVRIWDVATGAELAMTIQGQFGRMRFSPDETQLIVEGSGLAPAIWRWPRRAAARVLAGHESYVYNVAVSPDGRLIASGSWDRTIRLWDAATGAALGARAFDGPHAVVVGFAPDGGSVVVGASDGFNSMRTVQRFPLVPASRGEGVSLGAPETIGSEWGVEFARIWLRVAGNTTAVRFAGGMLGVSSHDRRLQARADARGVVVVTDVATGSPVRRIELESEQSLVTASSFCPRGRLLALWGGGEPITVWDLTSGDRVLECTDHAPEVYALEFSPDGTRLASAGNDARIRIWDTETGDQVAVLAGHTEYVQMLRFSPDGTRLVSGSGDGTVRVWDAPRP